MLRLEMSYGGKIRHFHLRAAEVRLGSAPDNDLVLTLPGISRHHALLRPGGPGLELLDLGSKNGLLSEGKRCARVLLAPGGEAVQIGKAFVRVEEISTSDTELDLELAADSQAAAARAGSSSRSPSTAEVPAPGVTSSPEAALRLVRRIERRGVGAAGRRSRLLAEACRTLGAEALLAFRLDRGGEMILIEAAGRHGEGELKELDRLARSSAVASGAEATAGRRGSCLLAGGGGRGAAFLAACFATAAAAAAPWRADLLGYLSDQLLRESKDKEPALPPPEDPEPLSFPAEMVPGSSPAIRALYEEIRAAAKSRLDVLLLGETGTGKELFARLIHASGPTAKGPFLPLSAPAIPAELLESELFGIVGRVATGVDARAGLLDLAQGGTVLLDEIGDLSLGLQTRLLRFLQEREIRPVGGLPKSVNLRVLSATNRPLERMVKEGTFREDLYFRLRSLCFCIPPLRERIEDLPALALAFAAETAEIHGKRIRGISQKAVNLLLAHRWPGNIRELRHEIVRAVLRCPSGGHLESRHFSLRAFAEEAADGSLEASGAREDAGASSPPGRSATGRLQEQIENLETSAIAAALAASGGNKTKAAGLLGLSRYGLSLKLKRLAAPKGKDR
ncbi:MAG TPA: sigma 54-interacting transcriptional regulator [Thermoanaerobaculia bacterium]|nr:sigma 54-interacting transcriptional regulator [Thermoanaerobaculia bacterium]